MVRCNSEICKLNAEMRAEEDLNEREVEKYKQLCLEACNFREPFTWTKQLIQANHQTGSLLKEAEQTSEGWEQGPECPGIVNVTLV